MMKEKKKRKPDFVILAVTLFLVAIGFLILDSVSVFLAERSSHQPSYFLLHQAGLGMGIGLLFGLIAFRISPEKLKKLSLPLLLSNILLISLVFLPPLGWEAGGAIRWLKIGGFTFQPSEFLKITFPLYLAAWLSSRQKKGKSSLAKNGSSLKGRDSWQNFLPFLIILGVISALLLFQPDMGTLGVIAGVAVLMYFVARTPLWHNLLILLLIILAFGLLIRFSPYRFERLLVFFNPETDPMGAGYQVKQALIAVGSGGIGGRGLGLSQQKFGFLPQPLSDSIFAIFAEETGFLGSFLLIALFGILFWQGIKIAKKTPDTFLALLAFGLTLQLTLQALVNICVLIGLLPLTGMPLPFISYGGSHLATELTAVGILLNISRFKRD